MRWSIVLLLIALALLLTEVEAKKKPKKPKKPKPSAKGSCANKGPAPSPKLFAKYTQKSLRSQNHLPKALVPTKDLLHPQSCSPSTLKKAKKCPCWWDITRKDCACCTKKEYQQCGWPMHKFCYKKEPKGKPQIGCPGVCNNQYTLSGKVFPC